MNRWRIGLLVAVLAISWSGYAWMFVSGGVRGSLALLTGAFALLAGGVLWHYRSRLTTRLLTANLALGSIVHLGIAGVIVGADRLWQLGLLPALESNWHHFLVGVLAVVGAAVTWTRARSTSEAPVIAATSVDGQPEPPPPASSERIRPPDWEALATRLTDSGEPVRVKALRALERIAHALDSESDPVDAARRVAWQEAMRLETDAAAASRDDDDDVLSQAASLLEWGAQKLPELAELDVSDLMMAKVIADIRAQASAVEHRFVDHRFLRAIHPIDRATADEKCNQRATAARAALPLLEANGMRLSEELIAADDELAAFKSVTGFQVVELDDRHFVTFEGNGRREALARAFGEQGVQVEVRVYTFADPAVHETIVRRVERVRRWKGVVDAS